MAVVSARLLRRVSWNVVDQGLSALSNVVLSIIVARSVDATSFGIFAVAFLLYGVAVSVVKATAGEPLQIRFSSADLDQQRAATRHALGFTLAFALVLAVVFAAVGLLTSGLFGSTMLALAIVLPGLLLQDSCRMAMFAFGRPAQAALIDGVWAVAQIGFLVGLIALGRSSVYGFTLAWGAAAALSALLGLSLLRVLPDLTAAVRWVAGQWSLVRYLFPEYVLGLGAAQLGILLVGVVANASAVGSLRGAQVLLGPLTILGVGAFQFAMPEVARRPDMSARRRAQFALALSAGLGAVTLLYVGVLLVLPDQVGAALFGDSWAGASTVLLMMGLGSLASSLAFGPAGVLYGMGQAWITFRITLVKGPVLMAALLFGTWHAGAVGAAWALALTETAFLPASWLAMRHVLTQPPTNPKPVPETVLR